MSDDAKVEGQNIDLGQLANKVLAGKIYEPAKARKVRPDNHNSGQSANGAADSNNGKGLVKDQIKGAERQSHISPEILLSKRWIIG